MNTSFLQIIKQIVAEQGENILSDAGRLKGFVSDYARWEPKEDRVAFGRSIENGFYAELKQTSSANRGGVKASQVSRLQTITGYDAGRCTEAIDLLEAVIFGETQKKISCSKCGKELQKDWKTCPFCATPEPTSVKQTTFSQTPPVENQKPAPATSLSSGKNIISPFLGNVECDYDGVSIKVTNSAISSKLFIDDNLIDKWHSLITPLNKTLILKAVDYPFKSGKKTVEVYIVDGITKVKFMVLVNGEFIGGHRL